MTTLHRTAPADQTEQLRPAYHPETPTVLAGILLLLLFLLPCRPRSFCVVPFSSSRKQPLHKIEFYSANPHSM
jgi:hypothetical protein